MNQLREHWEGVSLPGDYLLERWLSGDDAAGFFETSIASDGRRAVVRLVRESEVDGAAQLALWQRTRQLRHPNLRELLDCGRAELSGDIVLYAVFEHADDTLASALALSPLSESEAREVLEAVHGALSYLQSQGLAHAALDPDHVVAVGDRIKLSSDLLRQVEAGAPYIDELRAFWYKISPSTLARSADIFAQVLGIESRAGTRAIPAPASVEIPPKPDAAVEARAPEAAAAAGPAFELSPPQPNRFPKWVLVGAAGVVLLILGLNLRRDPEAAAPPPVVSTPRPAPVAAAVPPAPKAASPVTETIAKTAHQAGVTTSRGRQSDVARDRLHLPDTRRRRQEGRAGQPAPPRSGSPGVFNQGKERLLPGLSRRTYDPRGRPAPAKEGARRRTGARCVCPELLRVP